MTTKTPLPLCIGQPLPRNEDARLLTGRGQFTDDFSFPGQSLRGDGALAICPRADLSGSIDSTARTMPAFLGCLPAPIVSPTASVQFLTIHYRRQNST